MSADERRASQGSRADVDAEGGKTTILYRLQIGEVVSTNPTIGFNVETLTYKNLKLQVWDLGGQSSIRPYCRLRCTDILHVHAHADPLAVIARREMLLR